MDIVTIDQVLDHIKVGRSEDVLPIQQAVREFFSSSPVPAGDYSGGLAYQIFNQLVVQNRDLVFTAKAEMGTPHLGGFEVDYNIAKMSEQVKISLDGSVTEYTFAQALMHEIIHAVTAASDGPNWGIPPNLTDENWDYVGDTVLAEQTIFEEANSPHARASYHSTPRIGELENQLGVHLGESLTGGAHVGLVLLDDLPSNGNVIDTTYRGDDVLLIGMYGDDQITAGDGNDWLYGGIGTDTLIGGNGADHLFGNADNDHLFAGDKVKDAEAPLGWSIAYDNASDVLTGGTSVDTYYISGAGDDLGRIIDYDGVYREDFFRYVDVIDDVDRQGVIYDSYAEPAFTIGDRAMTFTYMRDWNGMAQYQTDVDPEDDAWSGYTAVELDHDGVHYLALTINDGVDVAYVIKNFQSGDFGLTLVA